MEVEGTNSQPAEEDTGEITVLTSAVKHVLETEAGTPKGTAEDDVSQTAKEICSGGNTAGPTTLGTIAADAPQTSSGADVASVSTAGSVVIESNVLLTASQAVSPAVETVAPTLSTTPMTTKTTAATTADTPKGTAEDDVSQAAKEICSGGNTAGPTTLGTIAADAPQASSGAEVASVSTAGTVVIASNVLLTASQAVSPAVETVAPTLSTTPMTTKTAAVAATGLGMLAQYDSDSDANDYQSAMESDNESVVEVSSTGIKGYRNQVVEIDSDSDTSTTDSDSDVDKVAYLDKIRKAIDKSIAVHNEDDDDEDDDGEDGGGGGNSRRKRQPPRVKGELLLDDLPPIEDLHISVPAEECVELGRVHSIVEQLVLVSVLPNSMLLDLETVLFLEKGNRVLGKVFDVLGQVADPLYCVRFNSHKQIEEKGIGVGDFVYVAPKTEYTQFVILSSLVKLRGSDASWENDVEPPPRYLDYSDDEQEREARAQLRKKERPSDSQNDDPAKRTRTDSNSTTNSEETATQRRRAAGTSAGAPGNFRPLRYSPRAYPPHGYRPHYQHAGSWHSNYTAAPPLRYRPPMPPGYHMYAPPPPLPHFGPYGPGGPAQMALQSSAVRPPMFVLNPYALRPPQHAAPIYHSPAPPPPPPGAQ